MKSSRSVFLLLAASIARAAEPWTIDAIFALAAPSDPQIRPDGGAYLYAYRGKIHWAAIDGGADTVIADGTRARWSPDGKLVAFLHQQRIHFHDPAAKRTWPGPVAASFAWSPQSDAVFFLANDAGPDPDPIVADQNYRYARLYRQPLKGGAPQLLTKADRHVISFAVSPDAKRVTYAAQPTPRPRDAFNVDLFDLTLLSLVGRPLVTQPGRDAEPAYSPDGKWIAFHSQCGSQNYFGARHVALVPSGGGAVKLLSEGQPFDVFRNGNAFAWSPDSRAVHYTAGQGVTDLLVRQDIATGAATTLAPRIAGSASFTPDFRRAVFLQTSTARPAEIFLLEGGTAKQLTHLQKDVTRYAEVKSEVVRWKAKDGLEVEGVLWLPIGYRPGQRVPMIAELHGGPTGATLDAFPNPRTYPTQVFLQRGIAVFSPNFRGSANYGADFRLKNTLSQGVGDYDDVMSGIDRLIERGIADPDRLGVMGWSYGGYLAGAVIGQTTRFKAASIGAPATDWITYYGQSDGSRDVLWTYFGGTPWAVPQNYDRHSSRARLKDIRTPSLLQVGAVDINHNGEIYQALVDHQVPVEYVVYPREGHGIAEPAHQRDLMQRNERWFLRWLLNAH